MSNREETAIFMRHCVDAENFILDFAINILQTFPPTSSLWPSRNLWNDPKSFFYCCRRFPFFSHMITF